MHLPRTCFALSLLSLLAPACALPEKLCIGDCPPAIDSAPDDEASASDESGGQSETGADEPTTGEPLGTSESTFDPSAGETTSSEPQEASCDIPDNLGPFDNCVDAVQEPGEFCFNEGGGMSAEQVVSSITGKFTPGGVDVLLAHADGGVVAVLDGPEPYNDLSTLVWDIEYPAPIQLTGVGDFNADGALDVVGRVPGDTSDSIEILFVGPDGALLGTQSLDHGKLLFGPAVADWNQDGDLDLVIIADGDDIADALVLHSDGAGDFTVDALWSLTLDQEVIATGDLSGDGVGDDFAFVAPNGDISLLITGPGDLGFTTSLGTDITPRDVKIADLGGDARGDVVVLADDNDTGTSVVHVLLQTGIPEDPEFNPQRYQVVCGATSLALAAIDGDAALDIAVAGPASRDVTIRRNDGQGGFAEVTHTTFESPTDQLHAVDFSGDGFVDVIGVSSSDQFLSWMNGTP